MSPELPHFVKHVGRNAFKFINRLRNNVLPLITRHFRFSQKGWYRSWVPFLPKL